MNKFVLVLDAMGVIYRSADDVAELLVPFVREHGGISDGDQIEREYRHASLGQVSSAELWQNMGLSPALEDNYLARHELTAGLRDFLHGVPPCVDSLWCLSNDVTEWSRKLRDRHELSEHFSGFVISGDVGMRKPDPGIYRVLLEQTMKRAQDSVFVDDRVNNLDAARLLGFKTVLFGPRQGNPPHTCVASFSELRRYLAENGG